MFTIIDRWIRTNRAESSLASSAPIVVRMRCLVGPVCSASAEKHPMATSQAFNPARWCWFKRAAYNDSIAAGAAGVARSRIAFRQQPTPTMARTARYIRGGATRAISP